MTGGEGAALNLLKATSSSTSPANAWLHYNRKVPKTDYLSILNTVRVILKKTSYDQLGNIKIFARGKKCCLLTWILSKGCILFLKHNKTNPNTNCENKCPDRNKQRNLVDLSYLNFKMLSIVYILHIFNLINLNRNNYGVLISLISLLIIRTWILTTDPRTSS